MASYYRDPKYPDFYWINTTQDDMILRGVKFWVVHPGEKQRFISQSFHPEAEDDKRIAAPSWVTLYRMNWVNYMAREQASSHPKKLKPNPALPILCRLSGFEEEKIKELIVGVN